MTIIKILYSNVRKTLPRLNDSRGLLMDFQKELSYLLSIPSDEIIRVILEEAVKDLKITKEEQHIIDGVRNDLSKYSSTFVFPGSTKITKTGLQLLLIQQRTFLRRLVSKT